MSDDKSQGELLEEYTKIYTSTTNSNKNDELEVVFGSRHRGSITRIEFESVISKLKSLGFTANVGPGEYHLNIQNQYIDPKTGRTGIGNIRTTIAGIKNIQDYCKTNGFDFANPPVYIGFMQKILKVYQSQKLMSINFDDFKFRVNYKEEKVLKKDFGIVRGLLESWNDKKKIFRLIKRFTFTHSKYPLKVDCSVVRSSKRVGRHLIPEFRIESSGVFTNPESYEIEIEADNSMIHTGRALALSEETAGKLLKAFRQTIKYVLSGIQGSNFPISYKEQDSILKEYMHVLYSDPPRSLDSQ